MATRQHPDTSTLLEYLDGYCSREHSEHIEQCVHCLNGLAQISMTRTRLHQLPALHPPQDLWQKISSRVDFRKSSKPRARVGWFVGGGLAVAASVVLAFTLLLHQPRPIETAADPAQQREYLELVQKSQQLESTLAFLDRQPKVISLANAGVRTQYRDSIATIDEAINASRDKQGDTRLINTLMRKRIELLQDLVQQQAKPLLSSTQAF